MMSFKTTFLLVLLFALSTAFSGGGTVKFGLLKYKGGGDWYANPTSLPNLVAYCNQNLGMNIQPEPQTVEPGDPELYNFPFVHMTGHGNFTFTSDEAQNMRIYLIGGGFLHIDDNYGLDPFVRPTMKKVFPELDFIELPFSHPIYRQKYQFANGLPKIHEHDGKSPHGYGLLYEGRLVCFYSHECDLGDGWEDPEVHGDAPEKRQAALQMGANIIQYIFTAR